MIETINLFKDELVRIYIRELNLKIDVVSNIEITENMFEVIYGEYNFKCIFDKKVCNKIECWYDTIESPNSTDSGGYYCNIEINEKYLLKKCRIKKYNIYQNEKLLSFGGSFWEYKKMK